MPTTTDKLHRDDYERVEGPEPRESIDLEGEAAAREPNSRVAARAAAARAKRGVAVPAAAAAIEGAERVPLPPLPAPAARRGPPAPQSWADSDEDDEPRSC